MTEPIKISRRRSAPSVNPRNRTAKSRGRVKKPIKTKKSLFSLGKKNKAQQEPTKAERMAAITKKANKKEKNNGIVDKNVLVREQLTGPAKLLGDRELDMLNKMDTSIAYMQKRMKNRVMVSIICVCLGLVMGLVMIKSFGILFGVGLALAGITWYMDIQKTVTFYRQFQLRRQIAFSQFTRLAAAYLPELKEGTNLYSIFERIVPRMEDQRDATALQKLMIDMQIDPEDSGPFLTFAHAFSVSDRAELIMLTIQQMYLGDVEDENIRSLADGANEDMLKQSDTIIAFKLKRFNNLTARIGICAMIPIIGYFVLLVASTVGSALGEISGTI